MHVALSGSHGRLGTLDHETLQIVASESAHVVPAFLCAAATAFRRIEPDVAHQALSRLEATDVFDESQQGERHDESYSEHLHDPAHVLLRRLRAP